MLIASPMASERARYNQLYKVAAKGGLPEKLPLAYGEMAALSADASAIIYTTKRDFQEFEAWKRHLGGRAPDLWYYEFESQKSDKLTSHPAPDSSPMWVGNQLYFLSERGSSMRSNLWRLDLTTGDIEQITHFTDFDVRHPSVGPGHIVFQNAGRLHLLDLATEKHSPLEIHVASETEALETRRLKVGKQIASMSLSVDGSVAVFEARGDIFLMDTVLGIPTNLTRTSGVADRWPSLSPDNSTVAFQTDESGEYQLVLLKLSTGEKRTLTEFENGFRYKPQWSPDGKLITFIDHNQFLYLLNVANGKITKLDQGLWRSHYELAAFRVSWSPDGRYVAWSRGLENRNQAIFIYDVGAKSLRQATSGYFSDFNPVFDPDGAFLYAISHRNLEPHFGDLDATWTYANSATISVIPLNNQTMSPFHPDFRSGSKTSSEIEFGGFEDRLVPLPVEPGQFADLQAAAGKILYRRLPRVGEVGSVPTSAFAEADGGEATRNLVVYDFKSKSETELAPADAAIVAQDGGSVLVRHRDQYKLVGTEGGAKSSKPLPMDQLAANVDKSEEYAQMFQEAWRYQRDFFYDPGQHGVDWQAVGDRYAEWVPYVRNDEDMTFVLHELVSELGGGHTWAWASSSRRRRGRADGAGPGLLGVNFSVSDGAYSITQIIDSGVHKSRLRSPLDDPGLDVRVGDRLVAVNGEPIAIGTDPWAAFEGTAEKPVRLTFSPRQRRNGEIEVVVKMLKDEHKLRELAWVDRNAKKVAEFSGGRIGYIYVPDTGVNGQNELMRQYRAQFNKPGLLIDERFNSGGALGDRLVELLNRPALVYFRFRNARDYPLPELAHNGPKALLINGWSYSGGDGFPHLFRAAGVGPLVGTKTWGGLIGPNLPLPLLNGGFVSAPPQRVVDRFGEWAEGNDGTKPDIKVENDPAALHRGEDRELETAVEYILGKLNEQNTPDMPAYTSAPAPDAQNN